jgi:hypothetical protein
MMIRTLVEEGAALTTSITTTASKSNMVESSSSIRDDDASTTSSLCSSNSQDQHQLHRLRRHRRRSSLVTFSDASRVLEYIQHDKPRDQLWYSSEELSQIKEECKEDAKRRRATRAEPERGLEHFVQKGSPRYPSRRKHSRDVVFTEHANQILEYGYLCDEERIACAYRKVAEKSRIQAIARGFSDAEAV